MSNWYEVKWPPTDQHPSLPAAMDIIQHYLLRKRGDVDYDAVKFASSVMLKEFRMGERRHLMLADRAINALEQENIKKRANSLTLIRRVC